MGVRLYILYVIGKRSITNTGREHQRESGNAIIEYTLHFNTQWSYLRSFTNCPPPLCPKIASL